MPILTELINKKNIVLYKSINNVYTYQSKITLPIDIDNYHIDKTNRIYAIGNNSIYVLQSNFVLIAANILSYDFFDMSFGCLVFWIEEEIIGEDHKKLTSIEIDKNTTNVKKRKYKLYSKLINDEISLKKELMDIENEKYKILAIDQDNYIIYHENILIIYYNNNVYEKKLSFEIARLRHMGDKLIILDTVDNIQIFNLKTLEMITGFKSLGKCFDLVTYKETKIIALSTVEGVFVIDLHARSIIKKKMKHDLPETFRKISFFDENRLIMFGKEVFEFDLNADVVTKIFENKINVMYKFFRNLDASFISSNFSVQKVCNCQCYELILEMKLETRRELFKLNNKIKELENSLNK